MKNKRTYIVGPFLAVVVLYIMGGCQAFPESSTPISTTKEPIAQPYLHPPTPSAIRAETDEVFAAAWFKQPFSGEYYQLFLKTNNQIDLWRVIWDSGSAGLGHGQLIDSEVQEIGTLLQGLKNYSTAVSPDNLVKIDFSFNLNGETRFISFNQHCPTELSRILEIVKLSFVREGETVGEWIPCQN